MAKRATLSADPRVLRRCVRDLVALSTLPAIWINHDGRQIAESVTASPTPSTATSAGSERRVVWEETGGPPVGEPERTGFGKALLERAIAYQHGGCVELDWRREGLVCRLSVPLEEALVP